MTGNSNTGKEAMLALWLPTYMRCVAIMAITKVYDKIKFKAYTPMADVSSYDSTRANVKVDSFMSAGPYANYFTYWVQ